MKGAKSVAIGFNEMLSLGCRISRLDLLTDLLAGVDSSWIFFRIHRTRYTCPGDSATTPIHNPTEKLEIRNILSRSPPTIYFSVVTFTVQLALRSAAATV